MLFRPAANAGNTWRRPLTIKVKKTHPHLDEIIKGVNFLHFYCQRLPSCIFGDRGWSEWHTLHNLAFGWFPLLLKFKMFLRLLDCVPHTVGRFPLLLEWFHVVEGGFPYHPAVFSHWRLTVYLWVSEFVSIKVSSMGKIEDLISPKTDRAVHSLCMNCLKCLILIFVASV